MGMTMQACLSGLKKMLLVIFMFFLLNFHGNGQSPIVVFGVVALFLGPASGAFW
jgi:hypothetical protein